MSPGRHSRLAAIARRTIRRSPALATSSSLLAWGLPPAPGRWCGPPVRPPGWCSARPGWSCPRPTSLTSSGIFHSTGATPPWPGRPRCGGRCPARPLCTPASPAWSAASRGGPPRCCGTCQAGRPATDPATQGRPSMPARSGPAAGNSACLPWATPSRAGSSWGAPRAPSVGCWRPRTATRCWCSAPPAATRPLPWSSPRSSSGPAPWWPRR